MAVQLVYRGETSVPVELEGLTPDWSSDKSVAEIERFEILHGNRRLPLAELFRVSGDASDKCIDLEGDLSGVHWIGAKMVSGQIRVLGPAGRHVGSEMRGGQIVVEGDAGDWLGAEMQGGSIRIHDNAGHMVGGAYRGSTRGMTGGTILVDGNVGDEVGSSMRRGLIAIGGSAGEMLGFNMIAGTVLVFGDCGIRPGAGMRRGTLGLFGSNPPRLLPTFRFGSTFRSPIVSVMLRALQKQGFRVDPSLLAEQFDLFHGDLVALGRGEILSRRTVA